MKKNNIADDLCGYDSSLICQFASYHFDEITRTETLCIAFTQECEFVDLICKHSEVYFDCKEGCSDRMKAYEDQLLDDESYPVMLGPVTDETYDEINRRSHLRHSLQMIYLPTQHWLHLKKFGIVNQLTFINKIHLKKLSFTIVKKKSLTLSIKNDLLQIFKYNI